MQENIMRVRKVWLIRKTRYRASNRWIFSNPVVVKIVFADVVFAIVAEPVIHTIAQPGTIVNHLQSAFPEVEALRDSIYTALIYMALKVIEDFRLEESEGKGE